MDYEKHWKILSRDVLEDVLTERERQVKLHGHNLETPNGTGPDESWLMPLASEPATVIETVFRQDYEDVEAARKKVSWALLLREELAEAMEADTPEKLEEELLQVAAVAVSWVEKLRYRAGQHDIEEF